MSGAEALLAFGVAANIVQFISFTGELCSRIREYSNGPGVPRKLALQVDQLDHLLRILDSLCKNSPQESLERQIVAGCHAQAEELYYLLESLKGSKNGQDHWWKTAKKALKSLSQAEKIRELQATLDSLVNTLGLQLQVNSRLAACFSLYSCKDFGFNFHVLRVPRSYKEGGLCNSLVMLSLYVS